MYPVDRGEDGSSEGEGVGTGRGRNRRLSPFYASISPTKAYKFINVNHSRLSVSCHVDQCHAAHVGGLVRQDQVRGVVVVSRRRYALHQRECYNSIKPFLRLGRLARFQFLVYLCAGDDFYVYVLLQDEGQTALTLASRRGHEEIIRILLKEEGTILKVGVPFHSHRNVHKLLEYRKVDWKIE